MHDPRVGRFFAVDPLSKQYPYYSPYQFSGNRVIDAVELEGKEPGFNWGWWFTMAYIKLKLSLSNSVERMASPVTQNNEAINNTPFLSEARKQQLYMVDATTATVDLQGKIMATSAITSGFFIGGGAVIAETGLASSTVITLNTELSYFASSGPLWKGAFASTFTYEGILQTSVSTGSVNAFTNLSGQVLSNGGKFDENINLSQPIFAFAFKGLPANLGESSFFLNYKGERDYSSPSQFTSSFTGNLLGGKLNSKLDDLFKPLKDFSITVSPTIDMTVGTGVEVMENAASKEIEELLNAKFSSQSKQAQNNSNKKKKKKTEED